jgi:hypothetical protein
MSNKSGAWDSPVPDTTLGIPKDFRFSGRSLLLDADGALHDELGDEEAVLVGTVTLDPPAQVQPLHLPRLTRPRNYPPDGMARQPVIYLQQAA